MSARPDGVAVEHPGPLRLGISSCLLGQNVRYDGGHKRNSFLMEVLGRSGSRVRLVMPDTGDDLTERMTVYAEGKSDALRSERLAGYVLKSGSPSCGMERVRLYDDNGVPSRGGVGLFAEVLKRRWPGLPVEEEGRLHDPRLRENFISRIFARGRWLELEAAGLSRHRLTSFHARHKYLLMSRDPEGARALGRLLGDVGGSDEPIESVAAAYESGFGQALQHLPNVGRHTNVLQHLAGYVSDAIDDGARAELSEGIHGYRSGLVPLIVPVVLLSHYVRRLEVDDLANQVYLEPHPRELMLLNHV